MTNTSFLLLLKLLIMSGRERNMLVRNTRDHKKANVRKANQTPNKRKNETKTKKNNVRKLINQKGTAFVSP